MIRTCLAALMLLLVAACSKPVDVTAVYARDAGPITIKAAANGDARIEAGGNVYVRRGGVDYVVLTDSQGEFAVREADFAAVLGEAVRAGGFVPPPSKLEYALSEEGFETIAGREGVLWRVHPKEVPSLASAEAVVSEDPTLAAVGKGLALQARVSIVSNTGTIAGPGTLERRMIELFEKGTVLRFGTILRLERLDPGPIAENTFVLPATLLDKAGFKARLEAERKRVEAALPAPVPAPAPSPAATP